MLNARSILPGLGSCIAVASWAPLLHAALPGQPDTEEYFGRSVAGGDFNGDGHDDVAVGSCDVTKVRALRGNEGASCGERGTGSVHVLYASNVGFPYFNWWVLTDRDSELYDPFTLSHADYRGLREFGKALASGDFDADGYEDLAIGVPGTDGLPHLDDDVGAIYVLYGSPTGLLERDSANVFFRASDLGGRDEDGAEFGLALTTGDFDGDGYIDLAIGAPQERNGRGSIYVQWGSPEGLSSSRSQQLRSYYSDGRFGRALASGELHVSEGDELVVGAPNALPYGSTARGAVAIYSFSRSRLITRRAWMNPFNREEWSDWANGGFWGSEPRHFGAALAVGDFDRSGYDDVAVGLGFQDVASRAGRQHGAVAVLYDTTSDGHEEDCVSDSSMCRFAILHQGRNGMTGWIESYDNFGFSVAAGDADRDGYDDLLVGSYRESHGPLWNDRTTRSGAVHLVFGSRYGLDAQQEGRRRDRFWSQEDIGGCTEINDNFGTALTFLEIDGDGKLDLIAAGLRETIAPYKAAGAFSVGYGRIDSQDGYELGYSQYWTQGGEGRAACDGHH